MKCTFLCVTLIGSSFATGTGVTEYRHRRYQNTPIFGQWISFYYFQCTIGKIIWGKHLLIKFETVLLDSSNVCLILFNSLILSHHLVLNLQPIMLTSRLHPDNDSLDLMDYTAKTTKPTRPTKLTQQIFLSDAMGTRKSFVPSSAKPSLPNLWQPSQGLPRPSIPSQDLPNQPYPPSQYEQWRTTRSGNHLMGWSSLKISHPTD